MDVGEFALSSRQIVHLPFEYCSDHVHVTEKASTGVATILVDGNGKRGCCQEDCIHCTLSFDLPRSKLHCHSVRSQHAAWERRCC